MALKTTLITLCSVPALFFAFTLLRTLSLSIFFLSNAPHPSPPPSSISDHNSIKVYVTDLPRSLNYDLLHNYWASRPDTYLNNDADHQFRNTPLPKSLKYPPYPENPLIKQYSAEFWILGDLMTLPHQRTGSFARRVFDAAEAVLFFATLSAELQLATGKGAFRKKVGNGDYERQMQVVDLVKKTEAWKRSGGRDHVFVLTDPVAMWHVRAELAPAVLLVVDFGGWYRLEFKLSSDNSSDVIQHTQVSVLKDVIVPYMHLLPRLQISENKKRPTLLYFKGAKHRHRGGLVREKLWDLLANVPNVIMEEGFPNATGREQSIKGMRTSEFCLHPAGDTPTSCRLFDAIQSLCIPVIVSDSIELPYEGMIDYTEFSVFVAVSDALRPDWLVDHLKRFPKVERDRFRQKMSEIQPVFQYDNGHPGAIGPVSPNGAVNHIWKKIYQKLPMIREAILRERRKPTGVSVPRRCHCT